MGKAPNSTGQSRPSQIVIQEPGFLGLAWHLRMQRGGYWGEGGMDDAGDSLDSGVIAEIVAPRLADLTISVRTTFRGWPTRDNGR